MEATLQAHPLNEATSERDIQVSRLVDAPAELVFAAFTKPEHVAHWWGPAGFSTSTSHQDLREGGSWQFVMHGPDGTDYPNFVRFTAVEAPRRLAYDHGTSPEAEPLFTAEILFEARDGKTMVTLRTSFPSREIRDGHIERVGAVEGAVDTLARFDGFLQRERDGRYRAELTLPTDTQILVTRVFDAPRELVWELLHSCEHLRNWYGPRDMKLLNCSVDARPGGRYRYECSNAAGYEFAFDGEFLEVQRPERTLCTEIFDVEPHRKHPSRVLTTLADISGKTLLTSLTTDVSKEFRDGHVNSGMVGGMNESYDRLDELVAALQSR